jgi:tetratricopeptide (TPR) repeat protein
MDSSEEIAELCSRLDNLPLAVELAAARAKALSPVQIVDRLSQRLDLFKGARDVDPRQQTLRATIDWSYELLADDERELLARLSVFAGGFTGEAVASVCLDGDETRALALIGRLVESSLVVAEGERVAMRYRLLETIRAYAAERLEASGMVDVFRRRHASHVLELARQVLPAERRNPEALAVLDAEHGNLDEAVQWAVGSDAELAVGLVAELWPYWLVRGYRRQGLKWAEAALNGAAREASPTRAGALAGAALLARLSGDFNRARPLAEEGAAIGGASGAPRAVCVSLNVLITVEGQVGDYERARARCEESIAVARSMGSDQLETFALFLLAEAALHAGRYDDARDAGGRALELFRGIDDRDGLALALARLGMTEVHEARYEQALTYVVEALEYAEALGTAETGAWCCEALAVVAAGRGEAVPAARLLGAAEVFRQAVGGIIQPAEAAARDLALAPIRRTLGADELELALESGRQLGLGDALAEARRLASSAAARSAAPPPM